MDSKINKDTLKALSEKGLNTSVYLEGIQSAKPLTYWDYIQPEALLNLQVQRTDLPDEMVFIVYHQINELLFKMILWEIEQLAFCKKLTSKFFSERLERISRYFDMLCSSFRIMKDGMDLEQYMKFRKTLAPASGFQSAQYRMIEFASTSMNNVRVFFKYALYILHIECHSRTNSWATCEKEIYQLNFIIQLFRLI